MKRFVLLLMSLVLWHPVLAQESPHPILTVPHNWSISGARWSSNNRDFWTWNREFTTRDDGSSDYQDGLRLWNSADGSLKTQLSYHGDNVAMYLDWSAGENRVLVYSGTSLEIWDALNGTKIWTHGYSARISGAHWDVAFQRILFWSFDDGSIHIWDLAADKETFLAQTNSPSDLVDVKWSPDEKTILGVLTQSGQLRLWDVTTGDEKPIYDLPMMLYSADWNFDGSRILLIGDRDVELLRADTQLIYGKTNDQFLYRAVWSPDRKLVAVRQEFEPVVEIWDTVGGNILSSLIQSGHVDNVISDVQWSKDNQRLLTHSPDGIEIWDLTTGSSISPSPIEIRNGSNMSFFSWSPDETKLIVMRSDGSLKIVTVATYQTIELELPSPIFLSLPAPNFVWNANGSQVMLSGVDNAARVWDTTSGKLLTTLQHPAHDGFQSQWVNNALWSPNEQTILTLGAPDYCVETCPSEAMLWHAPP